MSAVDTVAGTAPTFIQGKRKSRGREVCSAAETLSVEHRFCTKYADADDERVQHDSHRHVDSGFLLALLNTFRLSAPHTQLLLICRLAAWLIILTTQNAVFCAYSYYTRNSSVLRTLKIATDSPPLPNKKQLRFNTFFLRITLPR